LKLELKTLLDTSRLTSGHSKWRNLFTVHF